MQEDVQDDLPPLEDVESPLSGTSEEKPTATGDTNTELSFQNSLSNLMQVDLIATLMSSEEFITGRSVAAILASICKHF